MAWEDRVRNQTLVKEGVPGKSFAQDTAVFVVVAYFLEEPAWLRFFSAEAFLVECCYQYMAGQLDLRMMPHMLPAVLHVVHHS